MNGPAVSWSLRRGWKAGHDVVGERAVPVCGQTRSSTVAVPWWSPTGRLVAMCDSYGVGTQDLDRLFDLVDAYLERGRAGVLARVEAGQERFVAYWNSGLGDRLERALVWLREERRGLIDGTRRGLTG